MGIFTCCFKNKNTQVGINRAQISKGVAPSPQKKAILFNKVDSSTATKTNIFAKLEVAGQEKTEQFKCFEQNDSSLPPINPKKADKVSKRKLFAKRSISIQAEPVKNTVCC
jgi:hypothetical protein